MAVLALAGMPALAQPVTSPGPDSVAVTIYRAPYGSPRQLDLEWLEGYAQITEKRTVTIPKGRATIRFEGVAAGILPESAIVAGLPEGVREKNLDADLLSPYSLYARSLNRPVTIRRTLAGKTVEERAVIRSGPDGAAVVETREGIIAANCRPHSDTLIYDEVPAGLSAKPTLSVETDSAEARQVTVTLSYLAWGFDWQANYVATMRPDGKSADLFAWVTLANSDVTSFADAETAVIAGRLNRETSRDDDDNEGESAPLEFRCLSSMAPPAPPPAEIVAEDIGSLPQGFVSSKSESIVVTGSRMVSREELGDLKLFRIPDRTTVAAMSQKQVALLEREAVPVDIVYRARIGEDASAVMLTLRAQNRKEKGLGLPLPSGRVALFEPLGERRLLIGEGSIGDKAVGEEVEIEAAEATQVQAEVKQVGDGERWEAYELTVTNANPFAVRFEGAFAVDEYLKRSHTSGRTHRKNGLDVWAVEIPANGTATLRYRLTEIEQD